MKSIFCFFVCSVSLLFFQVHAEEFKDRPLHTFYVCENSLETTEWNLEFIRRAEQSIEFCPCFCGGKIMLEFLDAIDEQLEKKPDLKAIWISSEILYRAQDEKRLKDLCKKYPTRFRYQKTVTIFTPFTYDVKENHIKCLIVDEKYFSMGGTNFDERMCTEGTAPRPISNNEGTTRDNLPGGTRDQDVVGTGPIAKELRVKFYQILAIWENYIRTGNWEGSLQKFKDKTRYFPLDSNRPIAFVESYEGSPEVVCISNATVYLAAPGDLINPITDITIKKINEAKQEIVIGNLYCSPTPKLLKAIQNATARGVPVDYITNGCGKNAPPCASLFAWLSRIYYVPLFYGKKYLLWEGASAARAKARKIHIYEYDVKNILYHKKVMVIDKKIVFVGSYNFGNKSALLDYELSIVIESEEIARRFLTILERDKSFSKPISSKQARDWYFDPLTHTMAESQKQMQGFM